MAARERMRPIALIGLMGAGKSAVARALGERLGVSAGDLDEMVEAEAGCTIAELFAREGEPAFRRRESRLLDQALAAGVQVLACGGGIVVDAGSRAKLAERCRVVWLRVSPAQAARRLAADPGARPLLAGRDPATRLTELLGERGARYAEVADLEVDTDGRDVDDVAAAVLAGLARDPAGRA
jgi:shikimate kinase